MKKQTKFIIIGLIIILVSFGLWKYDNNIFIKPSNYNPNIYSVVVFNDTQQELNDITISYQHAGNTDDASKTKFMNISALVQKAYRKINIPTDIQTYGSYNVFVNINTISGNQEICVGYFGTNAGGYDIVKVLEKDGLIVLERVNQSSKEYKQLYRRHLKNQQELTWFE